MMNRCTALMMELTDDQVVADDEGLLGRCE